MFKVRHSLLHGNIQKMFSEREGGYDLRGRGNFKTNRCRTTRKRLCLSVCGVKLWNKLNENLKQCPNIFLFKKMYKEIIFKRYREAL